MRDKHDDIARSNTDLETIMIPLENASDKNILVFPLFCLRLCLDEVQCVNMRANTLLDILVLERKSLLQWRINLK